MIVGTTCTGKLLDWEYRKIKKSYTGPTSAFPKEYARLRTMPVHLVIFVLAVVGWGVSLGMAAHIAIPLIIAAISR